MAFGSISQVQSPAVLKKSDGAENVGFNNATVSEFLTNLSVTDYAALRALDTSKIADGNLVLVSSEGVFGFFVLRNSVAHGNTDNGGTLIVLSADWYADRVYSGYVEPMWFGAAGDGVTNDRDALVSAGNVGDILITRRHAVKTACVIDAFVYNGGGAMLVDVGVNISIKNESVDISLFGAVPNDAASDTINTRAVKAALDVIGNGGVITFDGDDYYFDETIVIDDGQGLVGLETVTYRENPGGQTRFLFTADVDGISYNGFASYRNLIKNIKVQSSLTIGTPTGVGINFAAGGGASTTRALGNVMENVTIQNFQTGMILNEPGDFSWFQEMRNIKIFRCLDGLVIDGSNGASKIDGLHIDASAGYSGTTRGIVFNNGNGFVIDNLSVEKCDTGLEFAGDEDNDRLYLNDCYFENNDVEDISFNTNCIGQLYINKARFAYFNATAKNQAIRGNSGADVKCVMRDVTFRGDQSGSDGLIRLTRLDSSSTRIWLDGFLLQQDCGIWQDFGTGKAPVYIRMLNQDKNGNSFELHRNSLTPTNMIAQTKRVSSVAPTSDTFVLDTPGGGTLDLKYSGASVRGMVAGSWYEWIWDGSAFQATP